MSWSGFGQGANAGFQGVTNAANASLNNTNAQEIMKQAQAKALLAKVIASMGGQQAAPTNPGSPVMPSGVSPQGAAMPPAAPQGMPNAGGAGPAPVMPAGVAQPQQPQNNIDPTLVALAQRLQASGANQGAQGYALSDLSNLLKPSQQNQNRLVIEQSREGAAADRNAATNNTREDIAATKDKEFYDKLDTYSTKSILDRTEKAREADQRSQDKNKSINERAKAAAEAAQYRYYALQEKAREADKRSSDRTLDREVRKQAEQDALAFKRAALAEKADTDANTQKYRMHLVDEREAHDVATETQAELNEQGRDARNTQNEQGRTNRATQTETGKNKRDASQERGKNIRNAVKSTNGKPPPLIKTQQEYDSLPSGTPYMEDDGNVYTKP